MLLTTVVAPICTTLAIDPLVAGLQVLPADELIPQREHWPEALAPADRAWSELNNVGPFVPPLQPYPLLATRPAIVCALEHSNRTLLTNSLQLRYPANHPISFLQVAGGIAEIVWHGPLAELEQAPAGTALYLAALDPLADQLSADGPTTIIARLLGPRGCPWDREQTHRSLRKDLLAETHEVLEAIDAGDQAGLAEELGDLYLQVLLHTEIARQEGAFTLEDVYHHLAAKLIRRHPHVFGEVRVDGTEAVLTNWEAIKRAERAEKGQQQRGTLDGVPVSLPALTRAQEILRKASKAGFDADEISWDWGKLREELDELAQASAAPETERNQQHVAEELGDVLLIAAKLARRLHVDAESALREAISKYRRRFNQLESLVTERGLDLKALPEAEKLALWHEAKRRTNAPIEAEEESDAYTTN